MVTPELYKWLVFFSKSCGRSVDKYNWCSGKSQGFLVSYGLLNFESAFRALCQPLLYSPCPTFRQDSANPANWRSVSNWHFKFLMFIFFRRKAETLKTRTGWEKIKRKRWAWKVIQNSLYNIRIRALHWLQKLNCPFKPEFVLFPWYGLNRACACYFQWLLTTSRLYKFDVASFELLLISKLYGVLILYDTSHCF